MTATAIHAGVRFAADRAHGERTRQGGRLITARAGRALEKLGHAIEYLADEYVHGTKTLDRSDPQICAIHLLMSLNWEIYLECSVVPSLGDRIREFLRGGKR